MLLPRRFATLGLPVLATVLVLLTGCVSPQVGNSPGAPPPDQAALDLLSQHQYQQAADLYLQLAEKHRAPLKQDYQLRAADALVEAQDFVTATRIVESLASPGVTPQHDVFRRIVLGRIALIQSDPTRALGFWPDERPVISDPSLRVRYHLLRAQALEQTGQTILAAGDRATIDGLLDNTEQPGNQRRLWSNLAGPSITDLSSAVGGADVALNGWIELAIIAKRYITDAVLFEQAVNEWATRYVNHPATSVIVPELLAASLIDTTPPAHIALLLPLDGSIAKAAVAVRDGFMAAWFEDGGNPQRPRISIWNSADEDIGALYAAAIEAGADFVVGPLDKPSVTALIQSAPLPVSTLTLNYADQTTVLIDTTVSAFSAEESADDSTENIAPGIVYQFALSPEDEARQVAARAWFEGLENAALVTPEGNWGYRVGTAFTTAWSELGGIVVDQRSYESSAPDMSPPISSLLGVDQSRQRYRDLRQTLGLDLKHETRRRRDVDFVFMARIP